MKGLRRRIGAGENTIVFHYQWLPRKTSFKPVTLPLLEYRSLRVCDMFLDDGS